MASATIRRKLAALACLDDYLCECNAVTHNPVRGVKRPKAETSEGKTPGLGDAQARRLLDAPPSNTLKGKRGKLRYLPAHPHSLRLVAEYLAASCHGQELDGPLFRRIRALKAGAPTAAPTPGGAYSEVVVHYMKQVGITGENEGPHAPRAKVATSALEHQADIARVQEWLGHANISTTRVYDRRGFRPRSRSPPELEMCPGDPVNVAQRHT